MPINLSQYTGFREIPLIPEENEPAFSTSGYGQSYIYTYDQNLRFIGLYSWPSGEMATGSYFNSNWNGTISSGSSWNYAGTGYVGPNGYAWTSVVPPVSPNSELYGGMYLNGSNIYSGSFYGNLNNQVTGVWVGKTKRDNLIIQHANNPNSYSSYIYRTCISTLGWGAFFNPITSTRAFCGVGAGVANGYNTNPVYGCVGYNETLKWWVIASNTTSASGAAFNVYKNIQPPTLANTNNQTFWNQFDHGAKITTTFTFPSTNDTKDYQHYVLFPLDNGNIAMIYKYSSNSINYRLFVGNNGVNSTSWTMNPSNTLSTGTTTSYHDSNFTYNNALPVMTSNDGKYVFVWTQYYYYGAGICALVIRVSDGQARYINIGSTTYAYGPVWIKANTLLISQGTNTDGSGLTLFSYDMEFAFDSTANLADISAYYVSPSVDQSYTSTNYGIIWPQVSYLPNFIRGVF